MYLSNTLRALDFFASLHLTIFEQAANFEFFGGQLGADREREGAFVAPFFGLSPGKVSRAGFWNACPE
jgi:hypothetical protein